MHERAEVCQHRCEIARRLEEHDQVPAWRRRMAKAAETYTVDEGPAEEFTERTDALFARRHPGWSGEHDGASPGVLKWLSKVTGWRHWSISKYRQATRKIPRHWWVIVRLLEERQDLRERLASAIREVRRLERARPPVTMSSLRVKPLYGDRNTDEERIQAEEWRKAGIIR